MRAVCWPRLYSPPILPSPNPSSTTILTHRWDHRWDFPLVYSGHKDLVDTHEGNSAQSPMQVPADEGGAKEEGDKQYYGGGDESYYGQGGFGAYWHKGHKGGGVHVYGSGGGGGWGGYPAYGGAPCYYGGCGGGGMPPGPNGPGYGGYGGYGYHRRLRLRGSGLVV